MIDTMEYLDTQEGGMDAARHLVTKGVDVLDRQVPGWWRVIKLDELNMASCHNCMLGQLFGHDVETAIGAKMYGLEILLDTNKSDIFSRDEDGFTRGGKLLYDKGEVDSLVCTDIGCQADGPVTYKQLKCAWAEIIAERRAEHEVEMPKVQVDSGR